MIENNKIWKIIGILFIAYMIIWLWPLAFHRPFFENGENRKIDIMPYYPNYPVQTAPGDHPEYEDPMPEIPYDSNYPDPIAPPHSSDEPNDPVACTMEAKACPDGSYVGRQGPNCEFAPCPGN